jgi:hypothetical protein
LSNRINSAAPANANTIAIPILNHERREIPILFNQTSRPKFTTIIPRLRQNCALVSLSRQLRDKSRITDQAIARL